MSVKESDLRNGCCTHEPGILIELWANFHTAAAGNAPRQRVSLLLLFHGHTRARAEVVGAVYRNPGLHALEVLKENTTIDREVANKGELREGFDGDGLIEIVHQRRTCHASLAIDEHGARAAN